VLINASGNGFMWLNGHDIGKHGEAGPQREFYLPECWLKSGGKNVFVLGLRQMVNGATIKAAEGSPFQTPGNWGRETRATHSSYSDFPSD
jgi:hypothetical protein